MKDQNSEMLCDMLCTMIFNLKENIDRGLDTLDTNDANYAADIIKDLAQAKYYLKVTDAMDEKEEDEYDKYYTPRMRGSIRYGYRPMVDEEPYIDGYLHDPDFKHTMATSDYGDSYSRYLNAKKHYTETHDEKDRGMMESKAKDHLMQAVDTLEDIWGNAGPDLRLKMKTDIKRLMESMN